MSVVCQLKIRLLPSVMPIYFMDFIISTSSPLRVMEMWQWSYLFEVQMRISSVLEMLQFVDAF